MDLVRGLIRNRINLLARLFCHKSRCVDPIDVPAAV